MRPGTRRKLDAGLLTVGALVAGGAAALGAVGARTEAVERLWSVVEVQPDGSARISEVVDYDLAYATDKHGIFRDVPGLPLSAEVDVSSPDAPADVLLSPAPGGGATRIRIGDADQTISGRHRYLIGYSLRGVAPERRLNHNAVGTGWEVPIEDAEVHITAPWWFEDVQCHQGGTGDRGGCSATQPQPGHLVVRTSDLGEGEGITIEARAGASLDAAPRVEPLSEALPGDDGAGIVKPMGAAAAGALGMSLVTSRLVRRAGRERLWGGGATDAAFGPGAAESAGGPSAAGVVRVDSDQLASLATIEFAPPPDITPSHGAVILNEAVTNDAKVAWLIEAAIAGAVELDEDGAKPVLRPGPTPATGETGDLVATALAGRDEVRLGKYDASFASAWGQLGNGLDEWKKGSGLWDRGGDRRRVAAIVLGILVGVVGALAAAASGYVAAEFGAGWLVAGVIAGAVAGAGLAAAVRAWELRVRTPEGSGAFLRVESFRRFLAESEAYHAEQAADRGVLREYTAWAVGVGEIDRWSRAVSAATIAPSQASYAHWVLLAPSLGSATSSASTAPSSSGGGGGGGVGGGSGGGGGGSW